MPGSTFLWKHRAFASWTAPGKIFREAKVASEPEALVELSVGLGVELARVGLEAGPLSQWLYAGLKDAGLAVELLETRHVRTAFKTMPVKTDRKDARGIAELMRVGWFRPVHCKSLSSQETRAVMTARRLMKDKLHDMELSLRGLLRNFGLKVGRTRRGRSRSGSASLWPATRFWRAWPRACSRRERPWRRNTIASIVRFAPWPRPARGRVC